MECGYTPTGGCDGRIGTSGGGDVLLPPPEHARTIIDLCLEAERRTEPRVSKRWWKQYRVDVDVEGMQTEDWEAERMEGEEDTDRTEMEED